MPQYHIILILVVTVVCYYFSFKTVLDFKTRNTIWKPSVWLPYSCCNPFDLYFIGYLQYILLLAHYGLATLIPPQSILLCLLFWQQSILSIAITGLAAYIGLSINPQSILSTNFYNEDSLKFSVGLGVALVLWSIYSTKIELKKTFHFGFWLLVYT
jgi:hypothetical protein